MGSTSLGSTGTSLGSKGDAMQAITVSEFGGPEVLRVGESELGL